MAYCPKCKDSFEGDLSACPKCNYEFGDEDKEMKDWVEVTRIMDKTTADYAKATLTSYNIPVAIISGSGFFGSIGLPLPSMSGKGMGQFQVYVPEEFKEDAEKILEMILGSGEEETDDNIENENN